MKDSVKFMKKIVDETYNKALLRTSYTHFDAINDICEYTLSIANTDDISFISECHEISDIIVKSILTGCFGKTNNRR